MFKIILIALGITLSTVIYSQELTFYEVERLGDAINTESGEFNPIISADGNILFFTRTYSEENIGGQLAGQDIWYAKRINDLWSDPVNLAGLNNSDDNAVVGISENGNKLFLINNYTAYSRRTLGLVSVDRVKSKKKWGRLTEIPVMVTVPENLYGFYVTPDEEAIVISMEGDKTLGKEDLYISTKSNGKWQNPKHLGNVINSSGFEISPFLSADKKTLYFSSTGFGGQGDADIFYSTRLDDSWDNWSIPQNLGTAINSPYFDAYFVIHNNETAYFSSNRGSELNEIFQAKIQIKKEEVPIATVTKENIEKISIQLKKDLNGLVSNSGLKGVNVKEDDSDLLPSYEVIYFNTASAELSTESRKKLQKVIEVLNEREDLILDIVGHTDETGNVGFNAILSEKRAEEVKKYLVFYQVDASRLAIKAVGETQTLADGEVDELRWDRRAELIFRKK